jgi:hypothetical protein
VGTLHGRLGEPQARLFPNDRVEEAVLLGR